MALIFFFILLLFVLVLLVSPGRKIIPVKVYLANGNRGSSNKEPSLVFLSSFFLSPLEKSFPFSIFYIIFKTN